MKGYYTNGYTKNTFSGRYRSAKRTYTDKLIVLLRALLRILQSDGFTAAFFGASVLLVVGVVGAMELGRLAAGDGVKYISLILSSVAIVVYRNNRLR